MATGAGIGMLGEIDGNHQDMIAGGIAGALVFGLFTAISEGDNDAYQYHLNSTTEGGFDVIQKQQLPESFGCVKDRNSKTIELIPVALCYCHN